MFGLLERISLQLRRWNTYLRIRGELESYNERELNDMGLSRADITRIALEAAALVKPETASREPALSQRSSAYL